MHLSFHNARSLFLPFNIAEKNFIHYMGNTITPCAWRTRGAVPSGEGCLRAPCNWTLGRRGRWSVTKDVRATHSDEHTIDSRFAGYEALAWKVINGHGYPTTWEEF